MRAVILFLAACLLLVLRLPAAADVPAGELPPRPHPARFVNDLAGVLRPGQAQALEARLRAYQDSTSTQLVVVLLHSTGAYEVADYTRQLGVAWGVGQQGKNNGLVLLAAIDQRRMAIQTGYGLEATITDALTNDIMREQLQPGFRRGEYYAALDAAVDVLLAHSRGEFKAEPAAAAHRAAVPWWFRLLLGIFGIVIVAAVFYGVRRGWRALSGWGSRGKKASPVLAGKARRRTTRRPATAVESSFFGSSTSDSDSSSSSDSSSDSADFGGGDFGGGGSSSDW